MGGFKAMLSGMPGLRSDREREGSVAEGETRTLLLLLGATFFLTLAWAMISKRVPDEGVYFGEIYDLAETGTLAARTTHPALVFTALGALFVRFFGVFGISALAAVRVLGAICVTATAYLAYRTVGEAAPAWREARLAAVPLVALTPMFSYMGGSSNSDTMLNLWCALLFFVLVRILRRGVTLPAVATIVVAVLLGAGTKERIWVLVPLIPVALVLSHLGSRYRRMAAAARETGEELPGFWSGSPGRLEMGIVAAVIFATVVMWRQILDVLYFRPLTIDAGPFPRFAALSEVVTWYGQRGTTWVLPTFWADFGYLDVLAPEWVYSIGGAVLVLSLVGLSVHLVLRLVAARRGGRFGELAASPGAHALVLAFLGIAFTAYSVAQYEIVLRQSSQGRYFFIVAVPVALVCARGLFGAAPAAARKALVVVLTLGLFAVNWYCLLYVVTPTYY